jgi:hypothetical protein
LCGRGSILTQLCESKKVEQLEECNYIEIKMYIYRTKVVHIQKDTWRIRGVLPLHTVGVGAVLGSLTGSGDELNGVWTKLVLPGHL